MTTSASTNRDVRNQRNLAEKQRRDKLNGYIGELASLVPMVTMSTKRLDKTSVLRLSAAYIRLNKTAVNLKRCNSRHKKWPQTSTQLWRPHNFKFNYFKDLVENFEGFIVVTTGVGKIIYVSHSVENFLGHQNIEMIGHSLTSFLHPSDIETVFSQIKKVYDQALKGCHTSEKISFQCRLREKTQPRSEVLTYQMVQVSGHMMTTDYGDTNDLDQSDKSDNSATNILFKGFVQIIPTNPMAELSLLDANLDEYITRHKLDGTLLFADHRISNIIGFLPHEVVGKSAYDYIIPDDHSIALFAQKLMLSNSNGTGIIVHRLKTSINTFVFLQTSGCLQYDKATGQIDHFVCVSRLLIEDEGDKERDKFVKRFTPHINNISPTALYESLQILISPRSSSATITPSNNSVRIEEIKSPQPSSSPTVFDGNTSPMITSTNTFEPLNQHKPQNELQTIGEKMTNAYMPQFDITKSSLTNVPQEQKTLPSDRSTSSVVQIHTLPFFPVTSAQLIAQQPINCPVSNTENLSRNTNGNSISNNIIGFYAPSVSLSYINQNIAVDNNSMINMNNSGIVNNNCNASTVASSSTRDLSHLLGATVLTLDSNQRPVLSVYDPSLAVEEHNDLYQQQQQVSNKNFSSNSTKLNSDLNETSPLMESSFYSPLIVNDEELPNQQQNDQLMLNYDDLSNTSTDNLLNILNKDLQCNFNFIEDQMIEESETKEENLLNTTSSTSNRTELSYDQSIDIEASLFSLPNTESASYFSLSRNTT